MLPLTLQRAIEIALAPEGNTRIALAGDSVRIAQARSKLARSALLPDLGTTVSYDNLTRNLQAFGIRFPENAGFQVPDKVGPFNVIDARAAARQTVFDLSAIRRFRASRSAAGAARAESESVEQQIEAQVATEYMSALRAQAQVDAAQANVDLAEALVRLAQNQKEIGTGTGIDVIRARVQLASERQRLLVAQNDLRQSGLQLLRSMGVRLDTRVELEDRLSYKPLDNETIDRLVAGASQSRADLKAQVEREEAARIDYGATQAERLPSLTAFADYGAIGTSLDSMVPTRGFGASVRLPLFDGGQRAARRDEAQALYRQERTRTADLREQIDLETRLALDFLRSAEEQVQVAGQGLELAEDELARARRRYEGGVAPGLEVTEAQTRLERARDNRIAALYSYNRARVNLGQATGTVRQILE